MNMSDAQLVIDLPPDRLLQLLRGLLRDGRPLTVPVTGWSMTPTIRSGDVLTIAPASMRAPRWGDVVVFRDPAGRLRMHRVVGRMAGAPPQLRVRGDNSRGADPPVPTDAVLGVVIAISRGGRPRRFGLGAERYALAAAARLGLLRPLLHAGHRLRRRFPSASAPFSGDSHS
ncbi:MAG: S24/S26 family peptidase [Acidobacteriota bacterium]